MSVPYTRLDPRDVYHYLEWVVEEWHTPERLVESVVGGEVSARLTFGADLRRLEAAVWNMPPRFRERALPILAELKRARLAEHFPISMSEQRAAEDEEWRAIIVRLRMVVSDWDAHRKRRAAEAAQEDGA